MAISSSSVFECRVAGSDTNGGGFVTGSGGADFSQQNSKNTTNQGTTTQGNNGGSITSGATTVIVTSAAALYGAQQALLATPLVGDWIKIDSEIMKVTAVSTNTLTITRAQLGTSAASHTDGATVTNISNVSTTDLVTASSTTITSAAAFFSANAVGNIIYIAGGTGTITAGWYQITAVGTSSPNTTATVDRSTGLSAGTGATMNIGGALLSPAVAAAQVVKGMIVFLKQAGSVFSITTASTNVAGGCIGALATACTFIGYTSNRSFGNTDTAPTIQVNVSTATISSATAVNWNNIIFDGNSQTSCKASAGGMYFGCQFKNFNTASSGGPWFINCGLTTSSAAVFTIANSACIDCDAWANTATPYAGSGNSAFIRCTSVSNTGGSTDGFATAAYYDGCVAVSNGRHGFNTTANSAVCSMINCIAESNTGTGFVNGTASEPVVFINCATYNNGTPTSGITVSLGLLTPSSSVFVSAPTNLALNNTANAGAILRSVGYPTVFPRGTSTTYQDIGAIRHQDPVSGGTVGYSQ